MADLDVSIFWDDSPDIWDAVYLSGNALPGLARVSATHGRKLDTKSAPGANGARIVDKGYQPAKVDITLKLWTKEQLEAWFRIAPTLTYRREPPSVTRATAAAPLADKAVAPKTQQEVQAKLLSKESVASNAGTSARARALVRHDFDIAHPALDTLQIHRVYIEEVSTPTPSGQGIYEVKIKAIESKAPRASSSRSVGADSSFANGIPTAFDATPPTSRGAAAP